MSRSSTATAKHDPEVASPDNEDGDLDDEVDEEPFECDCSPDDIHCLSYGLHTCPCRLAYEESHGYYIHFVWYPRQRKGNNPVSILATEMPKKDEEKVEPCPTHDIHSNSLCGESAPALSKL